VDISVEAPPPPANIEVSALAPPRPHSHPSGDVTGLQDALNDIDTLFDSFGLQITQAELDIASLSNAPNDLDTRLQTAEGDIEALQTALSGKANTRHQHSGADITSGTVAAARLGTGTDIATKYLRGDNTWQDVATGGGGGAWTLLQSIVLEANATTVEFAGLSGNTVKAYRIVGRMRGTFLTNGHRIVMRFNNDSSSNYRNYTTLQNGCFVSTLNFSSNMDTLLDISIPYPKSGYRRGAIALGVLSRSDVANGQGGTTVFMENINGWLNTADEVTSISFVSTLLNNIAAGSEFHLYALN